MVKTIFWLVTVLFLIGCQKPKDDAVELPFTNFLNYGEHKVGFKTLFVADISRNEVPYSDWNGKLNPTTEKSKGRNLPLHIWYPAKEASKLLPYQHFVNLITKQTSNRAQTESDSLAKHMLSSQINELNGDDNFSVGQLDTLLSLKTYSSLNPKAIPQKFPLVIFPGGNSPANQSILCEYLASHGYVVATLSTKGQFSSVIDVSTKGLEVAVTDLEFALQQLLLLPNVDSDRVALMGNAIESSFCAALASRNKKIKALISLEGGLLSQFEQNILKETVFYDPENITIPLLAIYAPHPNIAPDFTFHLKYSDRYFAHFPEMSEFHFLNFGFFEEYVPNIIGKPKGDVKKGLVAASELTLSFLNAKLKGQPYALEQFYSPEKSKHHGKAIDTLFQMKGFPPPPNIAILKNLFIQGGMKKIDSVYRAHTGQGNTQPFSMSFYNDFKNWLAWKKDPNYENRKWLYEMAVESYPNSALNNYRLAFYLAKNNLPEASQEYYQKAKKLLDKDASLDQSLKEDLKKAIAEALQVSS